MTREEIIALAKQHGASAYTSRHYPDETYVTFPPEKLEAFFYAAQALEREECAKVAEDYGPSRPIVTPRPSQLVIGRWEGEQAASSGIAAAISNRNNPAYKPAVSSMDRATEF